MLMRPYDGGVEDKVFEIGIFTQLGKKPLPNALFCPSAETPAETPEHTVPFAKLFRQISSVVGTSGVMDRLDMQKPQIARC
jgi:hypothetical protein